MFFINFHPLPSSPSSNIKPLTHAELEDAVLGSVDEPLTDPEDRSAHRTIISTPYSNSFVSFPRVKRKDRKRPQPPMVDSQGKPTQKAFDCVEREMVRMAEEAMVNSGVLW